MTNQFDTPGPEMRKIHDFNVPHEDFPVPVRLYVPHNASEEPGPTFIYFHGGGFVTGSIESHDGITRRIASGTGYRVISVDYRLAPEHPFPAALDDAMCSLKWIKAQHAELGIDASRIALAGDSSGGNIAAAAAQAVAGDEDVVHQLLFYPALDGRCSSDSYKGNHQGFLTAAQMQWYWDQYAPGDLIDNPRASPLLAAIRPDTAAATIIVAGHDPLHDDGVAYASALKGASVSATLHDYPGAIHGFASLFGIVPLGDEAVLVATAALRDAFDSSGT